LTLPVDFVVRIIDISVKLPKSPAGKHIADQIMQSGTSLAPNYDETRSAESTKDFIRKLKFTLKGFRVNLSSFCL